MSQPSWTEADLSRLRLLSIGSTDVPVELIEAIHARPSFKTCIEQEKQIFASM